MKTPKYLNGFPPVLMPIGLIPLLSSALISSASATLAETTHPETLRKMAALSDLIAAQGHQRIIVKLNTPSTSSAAPLGSQEFKTQQRQISSLQASVLSSLGEYARASTKRFETVPYVALDVDNQDFSALLNHPGVLEIYEDKLHAASLSESVPIIRANAAWASGYTGSGWSVAILDTGVDKTHPFLANKVVSEACYSTEMAGVSSSLCPGGALSSTEPNSGLYCTLPGCTHGTHVAGIAAGSGTSFSGVAKSANIIAIQVFSRFDSTYCSPFAPPCIMAWSSDIMKGLERVYTLSSSFRIASVNLSLGGGYYTEPCDSDPMKSIIDKLRAESIATVIASGNSGFTNALSSPACISSAISVGSTNDTGTQGVSYFSNSASFLTFLAPGNLINSSIPGGGYTNMAGTSMASPHVAGCWAILRQAKPYASVADVQSALQKTGLDILDTRNSITKPRIDCKGALDKLLSQTVRNTAFPWAAIIE